MLYSKLHFIQQVVSPKESSPLEKNMVYSKSTASIGENAKQMMRFYSRHRQVGTENIREIRPKTFYGMEIRPETIYGMPHVSFDSGVWFQSKNLATYNISLNRPKPILSDEILIVPLRDLSYEDAKKDITNYIQHAGGRKVYISELAEELRLDIELIMEVMEELKTETRD